MKQFDPTALAMALELAKLLDWELMLNLLPSTDWDDYGLSVSDWLRVEVQRELLECQICTMTYRHIATVKWP